MENTTVHLGDGLCVGQAKTQDRIRRSKTEKEKGINDRLAYHAHKVRPAQPGDSLAGALDAAPLQPHSPGGRLDATSSSAIHSVCTHSGPILELREWHARLHNVSTFVALCSPPISQLAQHTSHRSHSRKVLAAPLFTLDRHELVCASPQDEHRVHTSPLSL